MTIHTENKDHRITMLKIGYTYDDIRNAYIQEVESKTNIIFK